MEDITISGGYIEHPNRTFKWPISYSYYVSYCGPNKEGENKCNFYNVRVAQNVVGSELFFIERKGYHSSKKGFEKADGKAYAITKNIAKLFYRDLVLDELKDKVKIIDETTRSKPIRL